ncbi:MAG: right-handed parallel beta-helix repeat-containing protein, partial [Planctomycetes bacterium]|nr:right-handed parallel beta-helix repeat-containing protein [Planctomycetota bacterium]
MLRAVLLSVAVLCFCVPLVQAQTVWHVDDDAPPGGDGTSWPTAYRYLQDALAVAVAGDEVHVAGGTYTPDRDEAGNVTPGDREATFQLINGVAILGGYAGLADLDAPNHRDISMYETVLSGDLDENDPSVETDCCNEHGDPGCDNAECQADVCASYPECCDDPWTALCAFYAENLCATLCGTSWSDNSYHVVTGSGTDETAILDRCTITAGNADGSEQLEHGGGMYNDAGSPMVTNCMFSGNSATENGGGMYNYNYSSPTLTNCTFSGNSATENGGGMHNYSSSPTLTNCTFSGNSANCSGGMHNYYYSSPTLTNCMFSGNSANNSGGMHNYYYSSPTLTNCMFSGNSANYSSGGMGNYDYSSPTLTDCVFSANSANYGGGMHNSS